MRGEWKAWKCSIYFIFLFVAFFKLCDVLQLELPTLWVYIVVFTAIAFRYPYIICASVEPFTNSQPIMKAVTKLLKSAPNDFRQTDTLTNLGKPTKPE